MKFLNQWKDSLSLYKFSNKYDYHLPKIEYNVLTCLVKTDIKIMVPWIILKSKAYWVNQFKFNSNMFVSSLMCTPRSREESDHLP